MKQVILIAALLWGAQALFAQQAGSPAAGPQAVIREISGTVEIKTPGSAAWSPAAPGQILPRDAVVSTGFKSSARIDLGNSTLMVRPLTRLTLEELVRTESGEKVELNFRTGRVRAEVKPPAGGTVSFTVRSPTATASVRGTSFEFNGTRLRVDEGRVHLAGSGGTGTYVAAGHLARMDTETGRIAGAAETAVEELSPAAPAGTESTPAPAAKTTFPAAAVETGFEWLP